MAGNRSTGAGKKGRLADFRKSGGSKAKGRKPKFDSSKFSQSALGTPF